MQAEAYTSYDNTEDNKDEVLTGENYTGWTALTFAAYMGATECASLLIEKGADVNKKVELTQRIKLGSRIIRMGRDRIIPIGRNRKSIGGAAAKDPTEEHMQRCKKTNCHNP